MMAISAKRGSISSKLITQNTGQCVDVSHCPVSLCRQSVNGSARFSALLLYKRCRHSAYLYYFFMKSLFISIGILYTCPLRIRLYNLKLMSSGLTFKLLQNPK